MNLLLDTSVFLWFIAGDARLAGSARSAIRDPEARVWLSVVSLWEMLVKQQIGRLALPPPVWRYVTSARDRHGVDSLPLEDAALAHLSKLPEFHRDPFDRMLICQAIEHDLVIVTSDDTVRQYPVKTIG